MKIVELFSFPPLPPPPKDACASGSTEGLDQVLSEVCASSPEVLELVRSRLAEIGEIRRQEDERQAAAEAAAAATLAALGSGVKQARPAAAPGLPAIGRGANVASSTAAGSSAAVMDEESKRDFISLLLQRAGAATAAAKLKLAQEGEQGAGGEGDADRLLDVSPASLEPSVAAERLDEAPLPEGWCMALAADTQKPYFWHRGTKKTVWDRPTESTPIE